MYGCTLVICPWFSPAVWVQQVNLALPPWIKASGSDEFQTMMAGPLLAPRIERPIISLWGFWMFNPICGCYNHQNSITGVGVGEGVGAIRGVKKLSLPVSMHVIFLHLFYKPKRGGIFTCTLSQRAGIMPHSSHLLLWHLNITVFFLFMTFPLWISCIYGPCFYLVCSRYSIHIVNCTLVSQAFNINYVSCLKAQKIMKHMHQRES